MKKILTSIILLLSLLMISCLQSVEVLLPYYVTPGKYYTYIIQINGRGNGHSEPNDLDADDPVVSAVELNNELKLFLVGFTPYSDGGTIIKEIQ